GGGPLGLLGGGGRLVGRQRPGDRVVGRGQRGQRREHEDPRRADRLGHSGQRLPGHRPRPLHRGGPRVVRPPVGGGEGGSAQFGACGGQKVGRRDLGPAPHADRGHVGRGQYARADNDQAGGDGRGDRGFLEDVVTPGPPAPGRRVGLLG